MTTSNSMSRAELRRRRADVLAQRKAQRGLNSGDAQILRRADRGELSSPQQRMWWLQTADPTTTALNVSVAVDLRGPLDVDALDAAVSAVAARHEILRTVIRADEETGTPRAVVTDEAPGLREVLELGADEDAADQGGVDSMVEAILSGAAGHVFDLSVDTPLQVHLIGRGPDHHVLALVAHHVAWDDDCWAIYFEDLGNAYRTITGLGGGRTDGDRIQWDRIKWDREAVQYADATRSASDSDPADADGLRYWRQTLGSVTETVELPGESTIASDADDLAAQRRLHLDVETMSRVDALAREHSATAFMVLLAAFDVAIARTCGTDDVVVASPVVNRSLPGADRALGYFGNTVLLRTAIDLDAGFGDAVEATRDTCAGAFAHAGTELDTVVAAIRPDLVADTSSLVRLGFSARKAVDSALDLPGITSQAREVGSLHAQVPVSVMIEWGEGAEVILDHQLAVIDGPHAQVILDVFGEVLAAGLRDPQAALLRAPMMNARALAEVEVMSCGARTPLTADTLPDMFARQVAISGDRVAVDLDETTLTYTDVDVMSNRVARWLLAQNISTHSCVALCFTHSADLVIAALGVLKAGAAYVPVDPTYPADRIAHMLADSAPDLVIGDLGDDVAAQIPHGVGTVELRRVIADTSAPAEAVTDADRAAPLTPADGAYVIYTSGSTGLPKGVLISHRAIVDHLGWMADEYDAGARDALLQVASTSFDVSVGEIFGTLTTGARLVIPRPGGLTDIGYLTALLRDKAVSTMHFVPSLLGMFLMLPDAAQWRSLRRVPIGGEALPGEIADRFHETFEAMLHNFYGPTETTLAASRYKVEGPQGNRIVPIGTPKRNTTLRVLDAGLHPVPAGVIGELYIGGDHLAQGYLHRGALTAERFVADPFDPGRRLYRTGDLVRWTTTGEGLDYIGRADAQVKIRGFRIELGEIEAVIVAVPSVARAVVDVAEHPTRGKVLVGYAIPADPAAGIDEAEIAASLHATLPEHMVPDRVLSIDEVPLTPNGKLDRRALPQPEFERTTALRAPQTPTQHRLCALFADLLALDEIGVDDSFFDIGGHSLLATRLLSRVRAEFGVDISIRDAFDNPTVAGLAEIVDASVAESTTRPPLVPVGEQDHPPLSASQLRQWFIYHFNGASATYNIPFAARIDGPVDVEALRAALRDVLDRHEVLRTTYPMHGESPYQLVHNDVDAELAVLDVTEHDVTAQLARAAEVAIDLATEIPLRATLLRIAPQRHVLSVVIHHIASDEWSAPVLFADLITAYRARAAGGAPEYEPMRLQYRDFAAWQQRLLDGDLEFWRRELADLPEDTIPVPDRPRQATESADGATVTVTVSPDVRVGLREVAISTGASEFMVLQTGVAILLRALGCGDDIPLGSPISGRSDAALERMVGMFINTVVVRNRLDPNASVREAISTARDAALESYAHADVPFEQLVTALAPERVAARHPLFQVLVALRESGVFTTALDASGATTIAALPHVETTAKFDLTFDFHAAAGVVDSGVVDSGDELAVGINYRTALYDRSTIETMAQRLLRVLAQMAHDPDTVLADIDIATADERTTVLTRWGVGGRAPTPDGGPTTVAALLAASSAPSHAPALRCGTDVIDHGELRRRADLLAAQLRAHGAGPGSFVAIGTARGIDMVVALVATMTAGAAYLPLDSRLPDDRLAFTLADAEPAVIIVDATTAQRLPVLAPTVTSIDLADPEIWTTDPRAGGEPAGVDVAQPDPDDPAYLLFTSGSTGTPKGVVGTQAAMANRLAWQPAMFEVADPDVRLAQGSLAFLDGGLELLAGVIAGAELVIADDEQARDLHALGDLLTDGRIAQVTAVPSAIRVLARDERGVLGSVDRWVCSGEPLTADLLDELRSGAPASEIVNSYGTTESAGAVVRSVLGTQTLRIGRPMPGVEVYLLDDALRPVPAGVPGEIYLGGVQLAQGYWRRPGLTASRFVANPFASYPGARMYRTGDRARWNAEGALEFTGRVDHQIKIRGFRVELGEIEAAMRGIDGVDGAIATAIVRDGRTQIFGYVTLVDSADVESVGDEPGSAIRRRLEGMLPSYAVPAAVVVLDEIPLTGSGKLNRPALPIPDLSGSAAGEPPRTDTERRIAAAMEAVLGVSSVGRDDGFFALGGDSIVSVQLAAALREDGLPVHPQQIFTHASVAELAAAVDAAVRDGEGTSAQAVSVEPMAASGLDADMLAALQNSWGDQ